MIDQYLKISNGNGKMQFINSLNTNTLSNDYCMNKCTFGVDCYSFKHMKVFTNNATAWERNSLKLSQSIIELDLLPRFHNINIFRFNSHGELINNIHLINLMNIVKKNKDVFFSLWTKRNDLIKKYFSKNDKPKNLNLIFSNSKLDKPINKMPKYFDKTFNVINKDSNIKANCSGKCIECMTCYKKTKETTIIEVIK